MAGLGESCSQIAALLVKVEAVVRMNYTKKACTDEACKQNDFVDGIKGIPISKIKFYSEDTVKKFDRSSKG